jgi:hypothetical protein
MPRKSVQTMRIDRGSGQTWIRAYNLGGGWVTDYRLALQDGRVVVAELRVRPREGSGVPAGGLTRRRLRSVAFGVHVDYFAQVAELSRGLLMPGASVFDGPWAHLATAHYRAQPKPAVDSSGAPRRGRPRVADEELARAAAADVAARSRGSKRPVPDAARALKMTAARLRDLVYRARHRGLLTRTMQGRGGGALTPEARALLSKVTRRMRRNSPR